MIVVLRTPSVAAAARARADSPTEAAGAQLDRRGLRRPAAGAERAGAPRDRRTHPTTATPACSTASRPARPRAPSRCSSTTPRSPASTRSRVAYPAALSAAPTAGARRRQPPASALPGFDGRRRHDRAARHGRRRAAPVPARPRRARHRHRRRRRGGRRAADPQSPHALEAHGTELAGLLVGSGGPGGAQGVAPGASVLPIRVAGWQPDGHGGEARLRAQRPADRRPRARRRPERRRRRRTAPCASR